MGAAGGPADATVNFNWGGGVPVGHGPRCTITLVAATRYSRYPIRIDDHKNASEAGAKLPRSPSTRPTLLLPTPQLYRAP
jgi:hypothetical protein